MRFGWTAEQDSFAAALDDMLSDADVPKVARRWADGSLSDGLELWAQLAGLGVAGLAVPEQHGGLAAGAVDVAVAFERLGYHGVPGPWVETAVLGPASLDAVGDPDGLLSGIADGSVRLAMAAPPLAPYAVDVAAATHLFLLEDGTLLRAESGAPLHSVDDTRHLSRLNAGEPVGPVAAAESAVDQATLACAAQLLGAGERMLEDTVVYAKARRQFGRMIGEYQAVKHALADARVALDFARPLVHGAALSLDSGSEDVARDVSAAKVATSDAALLTARTALQMHGAIGYTLECDLSIWLTRTRALVGTWGTPSWHRGRVLDSLRRTEACGSR